MQFLFYYLYRESAMGRNHVLDHSLSEDLDRL